MTIEYLCLLMDSISNSGISLILNPDIANAINDHQHDLSTCEEEFEENEDNSKIHKLLCEFLDLKDFQPLDFLGFTSKWYYMNEKIRKNLINKNGVIWLNSYS